MKLLVAVIVASIVFAPIRINLTTKQPTILLAAPAIIDCKTTKTIRFVAFIETFAPDSSWDFAWVSSNNLEGLSKFDLKDLGHHLHTIELSVDCAIYMVHVCVYQQNNKVCTDKTVLPKGDSNADSKFRYSVQLQGEGYKAVQWPPVHCHRGSPIGCGWHLWYLPQACPDQLVNERTSVHVSDSGQESAVKPCQRKHPRLPCGAISAARTSLTSFWMTTSTSRFGTTFVPVVKNWCDTTLKGRSSDFQPNPSRI